jgi:hypothetical protein
MKNQPKGGNNKMEHIPKYLLRTFVAFLLCFPWYSTIAVAGDGPDEVEII